VSDGAEDGGSLIELLACVALLVAGIVVALGGLPRLAHAAQAGLVREAALDVARNAIERARAAAAYAPAAQAIAPVATFTAIARTGPGLCGAHAPTDVPLTVASALEAGGRFTVNVDFPRDPCVTGGPAERVSLAVTLSAPAPAPESSVAVPIADPALQ
jgi:type II secretory pathway pseudopilin PulG